MESWLIGILVGILIIAVITISIILVMRNTNSSHRRYQCTSKRCVKDPQGSLSLSDCNKQCSSNPPSTSKYLSIYVEDCQQATSLTYNLKELLKLDLICLDFSPNCYVQYQ